MTPRLRNTTLQIQMKTKTEDSLVFGWEGRHRSIFNRSIFNFSIFSPFFRFNITLPHAFEFALLLLIASSSRLLRVGRETEVLLAMKHSEPFLPFNTSLSFGRQLVYFVFPISLTVSFILYHNSHTFVVTRLFFASLLSRLLSFLFVSRCQRDLLTMTQYRYILCNKIVARRFGGGAANTYLQSATLTLRLR